MAAVGRGQATERERRKGERERERERRRREKRRQGGRAGGTLICIYLKYPALIIKRCIFLLLEENIFLNRAVGRTRG